MDELTFDESKARLEEIADLVQDPDISLDDALSLYEEAVKIGLHACDVSEQDILFADPQAEEAGEGSEGAELVEVVEEARATVMTEAPVKAGALMDDAPGDDDRA